MEMCEYLYLVVQQFHLCGKKNTDKQRNKRKFENRSSRQAGGRGALIFFVSGADIYSRCPKIYPQ